MSGRIDKGMSDAGRRMYLSSNVNQTPLGIEKAVDTVTILKEYFAVTCFSFLSFVSSLLLRMLYVRSDGRGGIWRKGAVEELHGSRL